MKRASTSLREPHRSAPAGSRRAARSMALEAGRLADAEGRGADDRRLVRAGSRDQRSSVQRIEDDTRPVLGSIGCGRAPACRCGRPAAAMPSRGSSCAGLPRGRSARRCSRRRRLAAHRGRRIHGAAPAASTHSRSVSSRCLARPRAAEHESAAAAALQQHEAAGFEVAAVSASGRRVSRAISMAGERRLPLVLERLRTFLEVIGLHREREHAAFEVHELVQRQRRRHVEHALGESRATWSGVRTRAPAPAPRPSAASSGTTLCTRPIAKASSAPTMRAETPGPWLRATPMARQEPGAAGIRRQRDLSLDLREARRLGPARSRRPPAPSRTPSPPPRRALRRSSALQTRASARITLCMWRARRNDPFRPPMPISPMSAPGRSGCRRR